jgi:hypothetical protein
MQRTAKGRDGGLVFGGLSSNPHGQGEKHCVSRRRVIQGESLKGCGGNGCDRRTTGERDSGPLAIDGKKFPVSIKKWFSFISESATEEMRQEQTNSI